MANDRRTDGDVTPHSVGPASPSEEEERSVAASEMPDDPHSLSKHLHDLSQQLHKRLAEFRKLMGQGRKQTDED
jgi:hypothetical protein